MADKRLPRIVITPGEPAGIGSDITLLLAQLAWPAELIVIADPILLAERAKQLHLPITLHETTLTDAPKAHVPQTLSVLPVACLAPVVAGKLDITNATYVLKTLELAAILCEDNKADAIVTGPVHKGVMNDAGIAFTGHTEFFAVHANVKKTVMLFVTDTLKVALATTHLPLSHVPAAITADTLETTLSILHHALQQQFGIHHPRIAVCGLNPHAGEGGHLGREEIEVITPTLNKLRAKQMELIGPLPADTIFVPTPTSHADAILAMYHDQALPVVKYASFGNAVNVTLGLPYIRTSVDHGTALDIAGTRQADAGSLMAALKLALSLHHRHRQTRD